MTLSTSGVVKSLIFLAGIWLVLSPSLLSFTNQNTANWSAIVGGVGLMLIALYSAVTTAYKGWVTGLEVVGGIALVLAPFVGNFSGEVNVLWNFVLIGALTFLLGTIEGLGEAPATRKEGDKTYI